MINRQWLLAAHPRATVSPDCFSYREIEAPARPSSSAVLVQTELLLCIPTIRTWIAGKSDGFHPAVGVGAPIPAPSVARIVESADPRWRVGDRVVGSGLWADFQWIEPSAGSHQLLARDTASVDALGIAGINALTAYFGLIEVGRPVAGETLLVSGAAGSVGSIAAQIGRIMGCRVVGLCGGSEKARWLSEVCRLDTVIDYRAGNVAERIAAACPDGIDIFYDNVGGALLSDVVARMRRHARIVLCGQIATYDGREPNPPLDMMRIIYGSIRLQGFLTRDYADRFGEARERLLAWDREGLLAHREDVRDGFDQLPAVFAELFTGGNAGTLIVRVADDAGRGG